MKSKNVLFVISLLLTGCTSVGYKNTRATVPSISTSPTVVTVTIMPPRTVTLSEQSKSGMTGTVTFQDEVDKTRVTVNMTGKGITGPLPNHIHIGSCPNPGAVKYALNDIKNGKSETVIDVKMANLFGPDPMAVNVHKSIEEATIYTACGDLK